MKLKRFVLTVFVAAIAAFGLFGPDGNRKSAVFAWESDDSSDQLVSELDTCIQERFKEIEEGFGASRIGRFEGKHKPVFEPTRAKEFDILNRLAITRLNVALYFVGFGRPNQVYQRRIAGSHQKGPMAVSLSDAQYDDLPKVEELSKQLTNALPILLKKDRYDFTVGRWTFSARPIRAEASCLECHHPPEKYELMPVLGEEPISPKPNTPKPSDNPKVGDPLGLIVYAHDQGK